MRRFPLRRLRLPLGSGSLSLVIPDANAWMRAGEWAAATVRGAEPPYWVQIWPASVAMARLLWRMGSLSSLRVLDLGCGLGVPGITACRGGGQVTFADLQPDALAFAMWNGSRQGAQVAPTPRQVDWSREDLVGTFDVMLLADVSYRPIHHAALRRHVLGCLSPDGVVVHADPVRRESTAFVQWLGQQFPVAEVRRQTTFQDRRLEVRLCVGGRDPARVAAWRVAMGEGGAGDCGSDRSPGSTP